jgi:hypothetical protein
MCKRKRFGEYEANPHVDDVVSKQYDLWKASFSNQVDGSSRVSACFYSSLQLSSADTFPVLRCVPGKTKQNCEKTQVDFSPSE